VDLKFTRTRNPRELKATLRTEGTSPLTVRVDLTSDESRAKAEESILRRFPSIEVSTLREAFDEEATKAEASSDTFAERLLRFIQQHARLGLFHSPDGSPFAWVVVRGTETDEEKAELLRRETLAVRGRPFREWLTREAYVGLGKAPNAETIATVVANLAATARFEGAEHPVSVRIGEEAGAIWLDLANEDRELVRIDAQGWKVLPSEGAPARLVRRSGMLSLPRPTRGGTIQELRGFLNLDDAGWILVRGFTLMLLSPSGPFPILIANGEQGSAKSTLSKVLRRLVDPNMADARRPPRETRDLSIAAANSRLVVFDNLSGIPEWLGDDLCALTSGNGFATRELYSDSEETIFQGARPVILNGIDDLATRGDIADRAIVLHLRRIDDSLRRDEREFWARFEEARPRILGALLDALSMALARLEGVRLTRNVRLADFARLVEAGAPALGLEREEFLDALFQNREDGSASVLDGSPFALAVRDWMSDRVEWIGTATELRKALTTDVRERERAWPKNPRKVGDLLRRFAPALRHHGIEVFLGERSADATRRRLIRLVKHDADPSGPSRPSSAGREEVTTGLLRPRHADGVDDPDERRQASEDPYADEERAAIRDEEREVEP